MAIRTVDVRQFGAPRHPQTGSKRGAEWSLGQDSSPERDGVWKGAGVLDIAYGVDGYAWGCSS